MYSARSCQRHKATWNVGRGRGVEGVQAYCTVGTYCTPCRFKMLGQVSADPKHSIYVSRCACANGYHSCMIYSTQMPCRSSPKIEFENTLPNHFHAPAFGWSISLPSRKRFPDSLQISHGLTTSVRLGLIFTKVIRSKAKGPSRGCSVAWPAADGFAPGAQGEIEELLQAFGLSTGQLFGKAFSDRQKPSHL